MPFVIQINVNPIDIRVHIPNHVSDGQVLENLDKIFKFVVNLKEFIMSALSDLQTAVAAESTVVASAIVLLGGIKLALDEAIASGDPAALTALSASIGTDTASLAAAITANTPVPPPPPPVP